MANERKEVDIYDYDKALTREAWHYLHDVFPKISEKCNAWAENQDQYKACLILYRKAYINRIAEKFSQGKNMTMPSEVKALSPSFDDTRHLHDLFRKYLDECNNLQGKDRVACAVNRLEEMARGAIAGLFQASTPPAQEYEYKRKKKRPGKVKGLGEVTLKEARPLGSFIQRECTQVADYYFRKDPSLTKGDYFKMCRESMAFRTLGLSIGRLDTRVKLLARKEGLKPEVEEDVVNHVVDLMNRAYQNVEKEIDATVKNNEAKNFAKYYSASRIKRVFASTLGSAFTPR